MPIDFNAFRMPGLSCRSAREAPGGFSLRAFAFDDRALACGAALRVRTGGLADGAPKALKSLGEEKGVFSGSVLAKTLFVVTTGSANTGAGTVSDLTETGFLSEAKRRWAETAASAPQGALFHFASGALARGFEAGRYLELLDAVLAKDPLSTDEGAEARPEACLQNVEQRRASSTGVVRSRSIPFYSPDGQAQFAAALFASDDFGFGAKTLVAATDLPVASRVLEFMADRFWLHAFGRWPGFEAPGDALLILSTGAAAARGVTPIVELSDPRLEPVAAGFRAAMFPRLACPGAMSDALEGQSSERFLPNVPRFAIDFVLRGAADAAEAERVRRAALMRLVRWRECAAAEALRARESQRAVNSYALLSSLFCVLNSALFVDAGIAGLERAPIACFVNDSFLMRKGRPAVALASGRVPEAQTPEAALFETVAGWLAPLDERAARAPLVIELSLGRGSLECDGCL